MKQTRIIIILSLCLASCYCVIAQSVVSGTNLNIGANNTLTQTGTTFQSNAIGENCYLEGSNSLVVGKRDTILNVSEASVALGFGNKIQGSGSMAFGNNVTIQGMRNVGIGYFLNLPNTTCSMAIGSGLPGSALSPDLFLENNYNNSLMIGFHSTKPTLTISPSPNDYPTGEHFNRTGKVAIGDVLVPDIAAKLHIRSDEGEDAGIFLQPHKYEKDKAFVRFFDENHELAVNNDGSMDLLSLNSNFTLKSRNVNISNGEFTLGNPDDLKLNLIGTGKPAFYSNAYRIGNACFRQTIGSSYAIEFKNDAMLFRTAVNQDPRGTRITNWRDPLCLKTNGNIVMNGKVGINVENTTANYTLAVDGGIITTKVFIQDVENWPDYVFDADYKLMSLDDLKIFIGENKHLPEMPSESEIVGQGYDMQEMQQAMMKKIEELTLYTIQQQEEIEALRKTIDELKGK
jgi:hypothetical protein